MKISLSFVALLFMLCFTSHAKGWFIFNSKSKVVASYLDHNYPNAKKVHQKNNHDTLYHVYFIDNDREFFLDITPEGEVVFKEKEIIYQEVPVCIHEYLGDENNYEYGAVIETEDGRVFYFLHFKEEGGLSEYLFNAQGDLLRRDYI